MARTNGGVYVKAAQFLASMQGTGEGILPSAFVQPLSVLTDRAPTRPAAAVKAVMLQDLGGAVVGSAFATFDEAPLAAASLAQVHAATLFDGTRVAVKVQHAELKQNIEADLAVLRGFANSTKAPGGLDLAWLVDDFERFLVAECDFTVEADNTQRAAALLAARGDVLVPFVHRHLCTPRVLVTSFVDGLMRVDDPAALSAARVSPRDVAAVVASVFADSACCRRLAPAPPVNQRASCLLSHSLTLPSLLRPSIPVALRFGVVHGDPHGGNGARPTPPIACIYLMRFASICSPHFFLSFSLLPRQPPPAAALPPVVPGV